MTEAQIRREFYCDFEAYKYTGLQEGSSFGASLRQAEAEGRIAVVPYNPAYKVNTWWDVGIVDYTAIWFAQETAESVNVIDFFINRGRDMEILPEPFAHPPLYVWEECADPRYGATAVSSAVDTRLSEGGRPFPL